MIDAITSFQGEEAGFIAEESKGQDSVGIA
jgi:hypothetical protein